MIYVVAFDPIKIMTCWAPQNDCQNLSFVKATIVVGKKTDRNLKKWPTPSFVIFVSKQSLVRNVIEREIKREKVQMKPPQVFLVFS